MKPYTFPICKMLYDTTSQEPSPAANGEAGPLESPLLAASLNLNCLKCKRTLIPGEKYADGFTDTALFCHRCNADHWWASYYAAEETIHGNEESEERYGR